MFFVVGPHRGDLRAVTGMIDDGRLTDAMDRIVPLPETRIAYEALRTEHRRGNVVVYVDGGNGD